LYLLLVFVAVTVVVRAGASDCVETLNVSSGTLNSAYPVSYWWPYRHVQSTKASPQDFT